MSRLDAGGRIDRTRVVEFRFQNRLYQGFEGDTLASALLASGVRLMGRSFKYHRPRGVVSAGSDEPNALMEILRGGDWTPNVRATVQEIYPGLEARAQNYLGALEFDALAVNDLLAPFLGAGFYYKTFMWPQSFWEKLYEPMIRRAAGLGSLSGQPDADLHEKAYAHADLLVIGAGPAGLMAALAAARKGQRVIIAEEDFAPGGRLLSEDLSVGGMDGADWAAGVWAELAAMQNVTAMLRTTATGVYDGGTYGALERVSEHLGQATGPRSCFWRISADRAVLATGALERPVAFPGNDRPGIMQAAALRSYLRRFAARPGQRLVIFAPAAEAVRTADAALAAGMRIGAIVTPDADLGQRYNARVFSGAEVVATRGRLGLGGVRLRSAQGLSGWIDCDCLAMSGGWNPAVHLSCHLGGRPEWRADINAFVPARVPGMVAVGAAAGDFSTHGALRAGAEAGGGLPDLPSAEDAPYEARSLWHVKGRGRAWLDFQNDVTVKDVAQAAAENFVSVEHMKRYTTLGMATDQGKGANVPALAILAELTGRQIPDVGTTTFRPPYTPVPIAAMGAGGAGKGFAPERFTPTHEITVAAGGTVLEAGLWYRPGYFPQEGDRHWREACDREVKMVRSAVGIIDVSTLGKIDVQGPDAAAFLDLIYTGTMSSLTPGRVRYGLMLREDGHVMDDGTCACLADGHYLVTTTTAAAAQVMMHFEFVHQCLRPDLKVRFASVTDQWCQIAVAGPNSRDVLNAVLSAPIDDGSFPYMGCGDVMMGGVHARLFRISFCGEHAYEIAVPSAYGAAAMEALLAAAKAEGGGHYGLEALNVLRIEKGHVTHAEIHGRTTARDCGLGRMVSAKKDCIGKVMAARPVLAGDGREELVGLKPVGAVKRLLGGSHIVAPGAAPTAENDEGYVTSVCYSPTLESMLALAFVKNGHARIGEQVRAVDRLRDFDTLCEICPLPFYDPEGGRLRG